MPQLNMSDMTNDKQGQTNELEAITDLAQSLIQELKSFSANHENLKSQFQAVAKDVEKLSTIIRDGNGKPSLVTTIALLENDLNFLKKEIDKFETQFQSQIDEFKQEIDQVKNIKNAIDDILKWKDSLVKQNQEDAKASWQIKLAIVSGAIGIITTLANILFETLFKR